MRWIDAQSIASTATCAPQVVNSEAMSGCLSRGPVKGKLRPDTSAAHARVNTTMQANTRDENRRLNSVGAHACFPPPPGCESRMLQIRPKISLSEFGESEPRLAGCRDWAEFGSKHRSEIGHVWGRLPKLARIEFGPKCDKGSSSKGRRVRPSLTRLRPLPVDHVDKCSGTLIGKRGLYCNGLDFAAGKRRPHACARTRAARHAAGPPSVAARALHLAHAPGRRFPRRVGAGLTWPWPWPASRSGRTSPVPDLARPVLPAPNPTWSDLKIRPDMRLDMWSSLKIRRDLAWHDMVHSPVECAQSSPSPGQLRLILSHMRSNASQFGRIRSQLGFIPNIDDSGPNLAGSGIWHQVSPESEPLASVSERCSGRASPCTWGNTQATPLIGLLPKLPALTATRGGVLQKPPPAMAFRQTQVLAHHPQLQHTMACVERSCSSIDGDFTRCKRAQIARRQGGQMSPRSIHKR